MPRLGKIGFIFTTLAVLCIFALTPFPLAPNPPPVIRGFDGGGKGGQVAPRGRVGIGVRDPPLGDQPGGEAAHAVVEAERVLWSAPAL